MKASKKKISEKILLIKKKNSDGNDSQKDSNNDNNDKGSNDEDRIKSIDFTLTDQYGKTHKLSDYEGKVVFLNFGLHGVLHVKKKCLI